METTAVAVDQEVAQKAFEEYRSAFRESHEQTDGEIMRAYKALAAGKTLISLSGAIRTGGLDEIGRPQLAIARADEPRITMHIERDGGITYRPSSWTIRAEDRVFQLPAGTLAPPLDETMDSWRQPWSGTWYAALPFIPPTCRPPLRIENYHLLWEATWHKGSGPRSQLRDPMLLRRVGGDLFAVVAAWDLTEVEKLVLARA